MSNKLTLAAVTFLAATGLATAANALTVTNQDTVAHDLKIAATGAKEMKVKVAAGASATVTIDCSKGCKAHLGKDKGANDLAVTAATQTITIGKGNTLSAK